MNAPALDPGKVRDRLQLQAIRQGRPLSCTLELTCRCNFHCSMCYIRMTDEQAAAYGRMRTVEEWLEMARQLYEAGVLYLTLTGGECTLYPGFERLYEQLSRMRFFISVMSNAGSYTDATRALFTRYPPHSVGISLYGGSDETYQAVTGVPGGYTNVVRNIRFFQSIGVPVHLNFTVTKRNVLDYPKVSALCRELGIPFTLITDLTPHQRNAAYSDAPSCRLSPAERVCVACHPPEEVALALANAQELEKELAGFRPPQPAEAAAPQLDACIGSYTGCAIYWNGEMGVCVSMSGYKPLHPFETGFEAAWAQLRARHATTFQRPAACQTCPMAADCMHNCAARRFEGTGSPHEPDPYTCAYTYLLRLYRSRRKPADTPPCPPCA